jgi:hypothetical protein
MPLCISSTISKVCWWFLDDLQIILYGMKHSYETYISQSERSGLIEGFSFVRLKIYLAIRTTVKCIL